MTATEAGLLDWVREKIVASQRWGYFYWGLHNVFSFFSWLLAIATPFLMAMSIFSCPDRMRSLNVMTLVISALGLILQVLASVMRFKERAVRGRKMSAQLHGALLDYHHDTPDISKLIQEVKLFLAEEHLEEGP